MAIEIPVMRDVVDISAPMTDRLPTWPGSPGWDLRTEAWDESGDTIANSYLSTDLHVGTHVEAPRHFLRGGATLDEFGLAPFIGPAQVVDVGDATLIDASVLEVAGIPDHVSRILFRTSNSAWWPESETFREDYVGLDETAARWLAARSTVLVGIDYLSIQSRQATAETHRVLMRAGVAILEGLVLMDARPGPWELVCLPLSLPGVEAAPARAILRPTRTPG